MRVAVILPAAGLGKRFAAAQSSASSGTKIERDLAGRPVFLRAIELFVRHPDVEQVILAVNPDSVEEFTFRWGDRLAIHNVTIVPGGRKERWETVMLAMRSVGGACTHVAVHDAARPLTSPALLERVFAAATTVGAVIPGLPVANTLKQIDNASDTTDIASKPADPLDAILGGSDRPAPQLKRIVRTVDRRSLYEVQTPQVFELSLLRRAYAQIESGALDATGVTDDASLVEAMSEPVFIVEGESTNFKITRPEDLTLASALLALRSKPDDRSARKKLFADADD
jgi:2-C-methyl-D-erythritol 4-phosphate cytidylyltransferase